MRPEEIKGMSVLCEGARVIGQVSDIDFQVPAWKISDILVKLQEDAIEPMGFKKPRIRGSVTVNIPVEMIRAVRDVVLIDKTIEELKIMVTRRK